MAYKILFFYFHRKLVKSVEEIGQALREARENIGISIEEAASDLKLKTSQLEQIEAGNLDAFKDVFHLKYFIRDYAKYLGLNYEDMIDEFNEYLFDYTSKISIDDIKKAKKQIEKKHSQEKRIQSPYTIEKKTKLQIPSFVLYAMIVILLLGIFYCVYSLWQEDKDDHKEQDNVVVYLER